MVYITTIGAPITSVNGNLAMATNLITGLGTPIDGTDAATKAYVDSVAQGLVVKASVRVATTADGTLATAYEDGDTIDGVVLATGDRILLKNQTTVLENGIYVVAASGVPARAADMAAASAAAGVFMFVTEGTANQDKGFVCTSNAGADTVGTHDLAFTQFSGGLTVTAGTGIEINTNVISIDTTVATLDDAQILTTKTINLGVNTLTGTIAQFNTALSNGNFCAFAMSTPVTSNLNPAVVNTFYPLDSTGGVFTVTLPAIGSGNDNSRIVFADYGGEAGNNAITITADTGDDINGDSSVTISANFNTLTLVACHNGGTAPRWLYV